MKTVVEIQQAILELPAADYAQLSRWFHELDWERWDAEIEQDSRDSKLDFLVEQAAQAKADGTLRELRTATTSSGCGLAPTASMIDGSGRSP